MDEYEKFFPGLLEPDLSDTVGTLRPDQYRPFLVQAAIGLLGLPSIKYRGPAYGRRPETGMDCSGAMSYLLFDRLAPLAPQLVLPDDCRHARDMFDHFGLHTHVHRPGNLAFFTKHGRGPTHVGLTTAFPDVFLHAPGEDNTKIGFFFLGPENLKYPKRIINIDSRTLYTSNPIGCKTLAYLNQEERVDGRFHHVRRPIP